MTTLIDDKNNAEPEEQSQVQDLNEVIELSEEQKKFLKECEAEFSNRYTDDDLDYVNNTKARDSCKKKPPIITNWRNQRKKKYYDDRSVHKYQRSYTSR